jgi:hypothetical protein
MDPLNYIYILSESKWLFQVVNLGKINDSFNYQNLKQRGGDEMDPTNILVEITKSVIDLIVKKVLMSFWRDHWPKG